MEGDTVVWGTSSTSLVYTFESNWAKTNATKSDWIAFEVIKISSSYYLQDLSSGKYVYSSADKKIELNTSNKTAITLNGNKYVYGGSSIGTYTYNSTGIRPYKSNTYTAAYLYKVTNPSAAQTTYTVTYNANGGTGTMTDSNSPYSSGTTVTVLDNSFTAPSGKQFDHWNTSSTDNGTSYNPSATFTITDNVTLYAQWIDIPPSPIVSGKVFEIVTDVNQLQDGDNVIILDIDKEHALNTIQNTNNRGASTDFRLIMNKTVAILNDPSTVQILRISANSTNWELYTGSGYLYAAGNSDNANYLKTQATNNENGHWAITIDNNTYEASIVAQGSNSHNIMRYNPNSGNPIYACYNSVTQFGLHIYKESSFSGKYTITFENQLGPNSSKAQTSLGEVITLPSSINICNLCYKTDWNLAGWVTSLDVMSPTYTNDYIPTQDITLYALYGRGTEPVEVDEYKLVTSTLTDWSGDYVITYNANKFADGRIGGTATAGGIGVTGVYVTPDTYMHGDTVIDAEWADLYNVTLEEISEGSGTYVMKTKDGLYNYFTSRDANGIDVTENKETAAAHPIIIEFVSASDIRIKISEDSYNHVFRYNTSGFFRFYKNCGQSAIYLYKKQRVTKYASTEYSTSPECDYQYITNWNTGSITVPAENLEDVTNPAYVTIKNIEQGTTLVNKTGLSASNGEYNISVTNLTNNSCDKMNILVEGTDSMYLIYKVPIIVSSDVNTQASIFTSETECATCDVVVLDNKTLTVSGTTSQNRDVKVYGGGTLSVPSGTTYTINSLALRKTDNASSYLSLYGNLNLSGDSSLFLDIYTDPSDWRWLAMPESFVANSITKPNGKSSIFGTNYLIKTYDGDKRAREKNNGWIAVSSDKTFVAGEGFIFGIAGDGTIKQEYRFKFSNDALSREIANKTLSWSALKAWGCTTENLAPNHIGWNLIGNPYFTQLNTEVYSPIRIGHLIKDEASGSWNGQWIVDPNETEARLRYRVVKCAPELSDDGSYRSELLDGIYLEPFECFFVQLGGNNENPQSITLDVSKKRSVVARHYEEDENEELFLRVYVNDEKTGWFISNKFSEEYEPGDDFESRRSIYQLINGFKYLYSAVPDSTLINGVYVCSNGGEITLDDKVMREKFEYIYIKEGDNWYNLLYETATVENNFTIFAKVRRNNTTTNLELIPTNGLYKFTDGKNIYINHNNKIYNITGGIVQ